ncbi:MAG: NAD-dependent protein deacylase [Ruminiclostridium sp.]|nr:NAD-dependent protein deacylase [Ruminiclostridium sp.]
MDKIVKAAEIIRNASSIVALTGAGASTESGIPDFRSTNAATENNKKYDIPVEVILSHSFFVNYTEIFYDYYKTNLVYPEAEPNDCHIALAEMEKLCNLKGVITQNIDGLHQKAGSKNVIELHGTTKLNYCMKCNKKFKLEDIYDTGQNIPLCDKCGGIIKPDVILYEEPLNQKNLIDSVNMVKESDVLLVIGTSLVVYPAAGLLNYYNGNNLIIVNIGFTPFDKSANVVINEKAGGVLRKLVTALKKQ